MDPFWHLQTRNNKAECSSNDRTKMPNTAVQQFTIEIKRENVRGHFSGKIRQKTNKKQGVTFS